MSDPNLAAFQARLRRIEAMHAAGTAPAARGAAPPRARSRRRTPWPLAVLVALLWLALGVTGLKAVILAHLGAERYAARLAALAAGDGLDRLGAVAMQADPVTRALAGRLAALRR